MDTPMPEAFKNLIVLNVNERNGGIYDKLFSFRTGRPV